jgi:hypothetical protein
VQPAARKAAAVDAGLETRDSGCEWFGGDGDGRGEIHKPEIAS